MQAKKQILFHYRCQYGDTITSPGPLTKCPRCKHLGRSAMLKRIYRKDFPKAAPLIENYIKHAQKHGFSNYVHIPH